MAASRNTATVALEGLTLTSAITIMIMTKFRTDDRNEQLEHFRIHNAIYIRQNDLDTEEIREQLGLGRPLCPLEHSLPGPKASKRETKE